MPKDWIILEDRIANDGCRVAHVMSNTPLTSHSETYGDGIVTREAGVYHFRSRVLMRGLVNLHLEGSMERLSVLWNLCGYEQMHEAIRDAANYFSKHVNKPAEYVFIQRLPIGAENGDEVEGVMLFQADWMMHGYVVIC